MNYECQAALFEHTFVFLDCVPHIRRSGLTPLRGWIDFLFSVVPWLAPWAIVFRPRWGLCWPMDFVTNKNA